MVSACTHKPANIWLYFRRLLERLGRRKIHGFTIFTACAFVICLLHRYIWNCVVIRSVFFRFWLGFGIGGDYPLPVVILLGPKPAALCDYTYTGCCALAAQGIAVLGAVASIIAVFKIFVKVYRMNPPW